MLHFQVEGAIMGFGMFLFGMSLLAWGLFREFPQTIRSFFWFCLAVLAIFFLVKGCCVATLELIRG